MVVWEQWCDGPERIPEASRLYNQPGSNHGQVGIELVRVRLLIDQNSTYYPGHHWAQRIDMPRHGESYGAQGRNRTTDTVIFSHVLYQLSYLGADPAESPGARRARAL